MKKCLINVEGGLGKNIMLTAILEEFKKVKGYDEIYVISTYYDVFKSCPAVTEAFPPMQSTLYQELVLDTDCDIYWKEPYNNQQFIKKECHLLEAWADELGFELTFPGNQYIPNLNNLEKEYPAIVNLAEQKVKELGEDFIIVQFCGGQSPLVPTTDKMGNPITYNEHKETLKRNYFKGQQIIDEIKKKSPNTKILHYALPNEPSYEGTIKIQVPYLTFVILAKKAKAVITINSSLQHIATGNCNNITVIWGETRPEHFGYVCNKNICAEKVLNSQPYFKPLGVSPSIVRMPDPESIIKESGICA